MSPCSLDKGQTLIGLWAQLVQAQPGAMVPFIFVLKFAPRCPQLGRGYKHGTFSTALAASRGFLFVRVVIAQSLSGVTPASPAYRSAGHIRVLTLN